ncbi:MAG: glycosyltransferase family 39 protein [Solirubrobacterales bacterium]|nr:glycosyltransferase family 39 protein [Solirubrobacterales bacterium]
MSIGSVAEAPRASSVVVRSGVSRPERDAMIVVGFTLLAAGLRFWSIGHQSFWYDEAYTVLLVHHSPGKMLGLLPQVELTPPLYYLIAWVWARIFGFGEAGLRSLSAVAGVAVVPAIYAVGAKLISRRAGLVAAALAACNPLLIWYSQEARSYSLLVLFATLSLLAFSYLLSPRPSRRWLVAWGLAAGLTLANHYYGVLAVAPQAAWLLWVHRRRRAVWVAIAAVAAFGLALLPIAVSQRTRATWIAGWPLHQRLGQIAPQYLLGTGAPVRGWLKLAGAAAVLVAAALLALRADARERHGALLAGGLAATGFLLSLVLVLAGVDELITRNLIVILIPLIMLVAGGLGARRGGVLGLAAAATLCTVGLVATIGVAVDWKLQRPNWRDLARTLGSSRPPRAGRAILLQNNTGLMPLGVYIPGLRFIHGGAVVQELDVVAQAGGPPNSWFCWWGSTCNLSPSRLDTSIHLGSFHRDGPVLRVGEFSILRLRATSATRLTPKDISRAFRKTRLRRDAFLLQR